MRLYVICVQKVCGHVAVMLRILHGIKSAKIVINSSSRLVITAMSHLIKKKTAGDVGEYAKITPKPLA
jgi:hypothetical protein